MEPRPVFDPNTPSVARTYDYLIRAVTSMVGELGIDQFIDLGSGLPTADNVHQVAQRADPELRGLIDLDRPVAVIISAILHHVLDSDDPLGVIRAYTAATSFGSCLFVSHFRTLGRPRVGRGQWRTDEQIAEYFGGMRLVEPGIAACAQWRPDTDPGELTSDQRLIAVGLGHKPNAAGLSRT